jgi:hypothetical protein
LEELCEQRRNLLREEDEEEEVYVQRRPQERTEFSEATHKDSEIQKGDDTRYQMARMANRNSNPSVFSRVGTGCA